MIFRLELIEDFKNDGKQEPVVTPATHRETDEWTDHAVGFVQYQHWKAS